MTLSRHFADSLRWVVPLIALVTSSVSATAAPVQLENGTATFSQLPPDTTQYSPEMAIDGIFYTGIRGSFNGWAINRFPGFFTTDETAVWQTVSDVGPSFLTFTMYFLHENPGHLLGRFRFSVTTDDRSTYADGLPVNGNVTANWTVLKNPVLQIPTGMTFTTLSDYSVLLKGELPPASGFYTVPGQGLYQVGYLANLAGITGIRLEVLKDPSLPGGGPGFATNNGNFTLTELQLNAAAVPEPATSALLLAGLGLLGFVGYVGKILKGCQAKVSSHVLRCASICLCS